MHQDLVLSDGGDGIREQCPEDNHAVMRVLSRLIRELVKDHLSDPSYPWGFEASLGWADLTDELKEFLFEQGSEVIHELTLAEDLGL